jgi:hypothetical protein
MLKDFQAGMDFGAGVNDVTGEVRNIVVTGDGPVEVAGSGQDVEFELTKVELYQDLLDSMQLSIGAEGSYGLFGGSEKFSFAEGRKFTSYSVFMLVHARILNPLNQLRNERLDPTLVPLITNNLDRFVERCGHLYVKGIQTGGEYFAVVEIITKDEENRKEISNRVDAGGVVGAGGFDLAVQFGNLMSSISQTNSLRILSKRIGGPDRIDTSVAQILDTVQSFPATVRQSGSACKVLLQDYKALDLPTPPNFVDLLNRKEVLQEVLDLRTPLTQRLNEVDFILTNPDQFESPAEGVDLNQLRNQLATAIRALTDRASQCINDITKCQHPNDIFIPPLAGIPERIGRVSARTPNLQGELRQKAEDDCRNLGLILQVRSTVDQSQHNQFEVGTIIETVTGQSPAPGVDLQLGGVVSVDILRTFKPIELNPPDP